MNIKPYLKYKLIEVPEGGSLLVSRYYDVEDNSPVLCIAYPMEVEDGILEPTIKMGFETDEECYEAFIQTGSNAEHLKEIVSILVNETKDCLSTMKQEPFNCTEELAGKRRCSNKCMWCECF